MGLAMSTEPLLDIRGVSKAFVTTRRHRRHTTLAADNISLAVRVGDSMGVVGESGSGKSTLANMIMGLEHPDSGEICYQGRALTGRGAVFPYGAVQIVFQDPLSSLDPLMTVRDLLREPLRILPKPQRQAHGSESALADLLTRVGLRPSHLDNRSHQFSGGQRQRIAIARALVTNPALIILDEPTSALDVSIQAQILNLLMDLQRDYNLTYLFISHNLAVVHHVCNRVAVLSDGRVVEQGETRNIFEAPEASYTRSLLAAVPSLD